MKLRKTAFILSLAILFFSVRAFAAVSYDRYAAVLAEKPQSKSSFAKASTDFLTYPFELLRWPSNKGLVFADKHYLLDKGMWLYEKAMDYGVTPRFDGLDIDFLRLSGLKHHLPDSTLQGWFSYIPNYYMVVGSKVGVERIAETPLRTFASINYENRPEQYFYGIGPHSSRGDGTSYRLEQTNVEGTLGYSKDPSLAIDSFAGYKRANITNGEDGGRGIIDEIFNGRQLIPGLGGDEIFSTGLRLVRDTRNQKENSTKGYLGRLGWSYNEGLYNSEARYFNYEAELIHFLRLGSDRRVFVSRFYGEHNNEARHHNVPFHQMAQLGGYGRNSDVSNTFRAYDRNRFYGNSAALFNFEYRYTVYEYRDWKLDTVGFWDEGQVFNHFGGFKFSDFRESYGGGFRLSLLNNVLISLEAAHGDEGTQFYVKSRSPF